MRRRLCHRPETVHASPLADRTPPLGRGVCGHHHATRHYAHSARRGEKPGGSTDCQGPPASGGHCYPAVLSVTALSLRDRYHIWSGRIRNIPSGSAIAAGAIISHQISASGGHCYPAVLSVTALSLRDRYHIWSGRIRNIPSGSAIAADAIISKRRWQHSDETDCPSRNWRTHVLMAFIRSRDSLTSME